MHTIIRDNYDPQLNEYHEMIIVDPTRRKTWLFDCDGVFLDITRGIVVSERGDSEEWAASQKWVTEEVTALENMDQSLLDKIVAEEIARQAEDKDIWDKIEEIELSSDVVDVVGTYAELQEYDTSKLTDRDIVKVLQDETRDNAISYYRWNKALNQFQFLGKEGPFYTSAETDALLATKQNILTAGYGIDITSDVISGVPFNVNDNDWNSLWQ